jgi:hypothetical protein
VIGTCLALVLGSWQGATGHFSSTLGASLAFYRLWASFNFPLPPHQARPLAFGFCAVTEAEGLTIQIEIVVVLSASSGGPPPIVSPVAPSADAGESTCPRERRGATYYRMPWFQLPTAGSACSASVCQSGTARQRTGQERHTHMMMGIASALLQPRNLYFSWTGNVAVLPIPAAGRSVWDDDSSGRCHVRPPPSKHQAAGVQRSPRAKPGTKVTVASQRPPRQPHLRFFVHAPSPSLRPTPFPSSSYTHVSFFSFLHTSALCCACLSTLSRPESCKAPFCSPSPCAIVPRCIRATMHPRRCSFSQLLTVRLRTGVTAALIGGPQPPV